MLFFFVIRNVQTFHFFRHQLHVGIITTTATFPAFSFLKVRDLSHENLNPFIGACIESPNILLVWSYCKKGSLQVCNSFVRYTSLLKHLFVSSSGEATTLHIKGPKMHLAPAYIFQYVPYSHFLLERFSIDCRE